MSIIYLVQLLRPYNNISWLEFLIGLNRREVEMGWVITDWFWSNPTIDDTSVWLEDHQFQSPDFYILTFYILLFYILNMYFVQGLELWRAKIEDFFPICLYQREYS